MTSTAGADILAQEQALTRAKAEHDQVLLVRAKELLDQIQEAAVELGDLAGEFLTPHIGVHLLSVKLDVERAQNAVDYGTKVISPALAVA